MLKKAFIYTADFLSQDDLILILILPNEPIRFKNEFFRCSTF